MSFVPFTKDDQPTMAAFNEKFEQAIQAASEGSIKIATGSYTGTGKAGPSDPNTISLPFKPKALFIFKDFSSQGGSAYIGFWCYGNPTMSGNISDTGTMQNNVLSSDENFSWYSINGNQLNQLNAASINYYYFAIG